MDLQIEEIEQKDVRRKYTLISDNLHLMKSRNHNTSFNFLEFLEDRQMYDLNESDFYLHIQNDTVPTSSESTNCTVMTYVLCGHLRISKNHMNKLYSISIL